MKTINFIFDNGTDQRPLSGTLNLKFDFLELEFEVVKVQKYFYILCKGCYMFANTFDYTTAMELQMYFIDKCTRYGITKEFVLNFIKERNEKLN